MWESWLQMLGSITSEVFKSKDQTFGKAHGTEQSISLTHYVHIFTVDCFKCLCASVSWAKHIIQSLFAVIWRTEVCPATLHLNLAFALMETTQNDIIILEPSTWLAPINYEKKIIFGSSNNLNVCLWYVHTIYYRKLRKQASLIHLTSW